MRSIFKYLQTNFVLMGAGIQSEELIRVLRDIDARLRVIEEVLGVSYDDEGILDPAVVQELRRREKEGTVSEDDFWRAAGVED